MSQSWWCECGAMNGQPHQPPSSVDRCRICGCDRPGMVRIRYRRPLGRQWHVALPLLDQRRSSAEARLTKAERKAQYLERRELRLRSQAEVFKRRS